MNKIVCVGNQFVQGDDFGPRVYARLLKRPLPENIQVIDGGIAGLNLLNYFDGCERLIFVDSLGEDLSPDEVLILKDNELITEETAYSHASGLGYVLQADRAIRGDKFPCIFLVGAGAEATEQAVDNAAEHCEKLAMGG